MSQELQFNGELRVRAAIIVFGSVLLSTAADAMAIAGLPHRCDPAGAQIRIQSATATATRRKVGFQCGAGCATKYYLSKKQERFYEQIFNWGCTVDISTVIYRKQTYRYNHITTVDPDWTAAGVAVADGCLSYEPRQSTGATGSYTHIERGNLPGAADIIKSDYTYLSDGWKDRLNGGEPVEDPWIKYADEWGWADWAPGTTAHCGTGGYVGPASTATPCPSGSGSSTVSQEGRDQIVLAPESEYTTAMLQSKVDGLASARLGGFADQDPVSSNWLSATGDCARADRSKYRFVVTGTIPGDYYMVGWTEVRRSADGATVAVERRASMKAPDAATWHFPSESGVALAAPAWPEACPGGGGENSVWLTEVSIAPASYKASATLADSRALPGTGYVGAATPGQTEACSGCAGSASPGSDYPGVSFSISLGGGTSDGPGGQLYLSEYTPDAGLATPGKLRFSGVPDAATGVGVSTDSATAWITGAFTRQARATVLLLPAPRRGYAIQVRDPSGATLLSTWTIEDPGGTGGATHNRLRIIQDGPNGASRVWDFQHTPISGGWEVTTDGASSKQILTQGGGVQTRTEEIKIMAPSGPGILYRSARVYRRFSWGEALESETLGEGASARTTAYSYLESGAAPLPYPASTAEPPLRSVSRWDGSWEFVTGYDFRGRPAGVLTGLDTGLTASPAAASCQGEDYSYAPQDPADDGSVEPATPRVVTRKFRGIPVAKTIRVLTPAEGREIQCASPAGSMQDTNNRVTITSYHTSGLSRGRVRSIERPDKTMSFHAEETLPDGSTVETVQDGEPNTARTAIRNGVKTVTTHGRLGQIQSVITYHLSNGIQGAVLSSDVYSLFDSQSRPTKVTHLDNTFETAAYACCGLASMTDREGVQTLYMYDAAGRLERTTRAGVAIHHLRDAAGNSYATKSVAGGSELFLSGAGINAAGEVFAQTNSFSGVTRFADGFDAALGHRVRTTTHPDEGITTEIFYRDGRLKKIIGSAASAARFEYGAEDDDLTDTDGTAKMFTLEIKLDSAGADTPERLKTYEDALGRTFKVAFASSANPAISPHTAAIPQVSSRTFYNPQGQRVRETDPDGVSTLYAYNAKGELQDTAINCNAGSSIDPGGTDRITRVTSEVSARGSIPVTRTVTSQWIDGGDATLTIATTEISLDGRWSWETLWNSSQAVTTSRETVVEPATQTRRVILIRPDGASETTVYQSGRLLSVTSKNAAQAVIESTSYGYDVHGRLRQQDDPHHGATTHSYPSATETVVTTPSPRAGEPGQVTRTTLDNQGRPVRVTHPDLAVTTTEYDPNGQLRKTHGSRTYPVEYRYDAQGRLKTQWTWKAHTAVPAERSESTWSYDPYRGWLSGKTGADSKGPRYSYSNAGRLKSRKWARHNSQGLPLTATYTYGFEDGAANNDHGDLVGVAYNENNAAQGLAMTYDRRGRLAAAVKAGLTTTLAHSDHGQLISESYSGGGGSELAIRFYGITVGQDLDSMSRRQTAWIRKHGASLHSVAHTYDSASRLQSVASSGFSAQYRRDPGGSLVEGITVAFNGAARLVVGKEHDHLGRLRSITNTAGVVVASTHAYRYNAANQRDQVTVADGSRWQYQYDSLGQVTSGKRRWSDNALVAGQQFEYEYDDIGNRKRTLAGGDAAGTGLRESVYNTDGMKGLLNQYHQRTVPGGLDVMGVANRSAIVNINGQGVYRKNEYYHKTLTGNNAGAPAQMSVQVAAYLNGGAAVQNGVLILPPNPEMFVYDEDGNLLADGLWEYTWDAENRLVRQASKPSAPRQRLVVYDYDWRGRRVSKKVWDNSWGSGSPTTTAYFLYDLPTGQEGGWNLMAQLDSMGTITRCYVWGEDLSGSLDGAGGVGGLLAMREASGVVHLCGYDGNGNLTTLIEAATGMVKASYEYGPFGEPLRVSGPMARANPFRWSTKFTDDETDQVYYGYRYYSPSPGRWLTRDPIGEDGGLNVYGFVENSPINFYDVLGLWTGGDHKRLTEESFAKADVSSVLGSCAKPVLTWLKHWNLQQDEGAAFQENRRHYNRNIDMPTGSTAARMGRNYSAYLVEELGRFNMKLRSKSPSRQECKDALEFLGRLTHSWQDYYAHAIILVRGKADKKLWTQKPPITGSPDNPFGTGGHIVPSSWDGVLSPGEHGWGEVGGREGAARQSDARQFVAGKYKSLIPRWAAKCQCYCD